MQGNGVNLQGFVSNISCLTNLLETLESWTASLDNRNMLGVDTVYLDYQKGIWSSTTQTTVTKVEDIRDRRSYTRFDIFLFNWSPHDIFNQRPDIWRFTVSFWSTLRFSNRTHPISHICQRYSSSCRLPNQAFCWRQEGLVTNTKFRRSSVPPEWPVKCMWLVVQMATQLQCPKSVNVCISV